LRVVTRLDELPAVALYLDPGGVENRALVLTDEVHRQPLPLCLYLEADLPERVALVFIGQEGAANRGVDGDRGDLVPSVQAAMGGDRGFE
jgi:hypothetical protein